MNAFQDLRFAFSNAVGCRPAVFFPLRHLRGRGVENLVTPQTGITIEGFPRSGTSFAMRAFQSANPEVRIAHHHHAAAQLLRSADLGLPTLLILRPPESAVRSLLIRRPGLRPTTALAAYQRFHERLAICRQSIVVASFAQITGDFGRVIDRVNAFYETTFERFVHDEANVETIFRAMERDNTAAYGRLLSTHVPRPDPERDSVKDRIRFDDSQEALTGARAAYEFLLDGA